MYKYSLSVEPIFEGVKAVLHREQPKRHIIEVIDHRNAYLAVEVALRNCEITPSDVGVLMPDGTVEDSGEQTLIEAVCAVGNVPYFFADDES